ncbi:uncharacterized protein KD926_011050 [Aspergillus affinis]|uniref:uncharacterized protein n=1 Tax=Aspergillus affinis TaxID=1070780 RepID=UPI0022FF36A1|nr:uncharacterized protein KD926_011050 [Aspergillus affinis]KAI9044877.1 hypothetical protein KD926_011050 [Aspergillus affinis]
MGSRAVSLLSTVGLLLSPVSLVLATPVGSEPRALGQTFLGSDSVSAPSSQSVEHTGNHEHDTTYTDSDSVAATAAPSWFTSTLMARRLLALSTTGVISTIFPSPAPDKSHTPASLAGQSVSLREYISDCDEHLPRDTSHGGNGDPTLLGLRVSSTFRNIAAGSNLSVSIDWWDHINDTKPVFPGFPLSEAGLPRVTLFGYVEEFPTPVPEDTSEALTSCYTKAHPDARVWLPGKAGSPHSSFWARMVVTEIYWIGGFGGLQQIGWINATEWKGIRRTGSLEGVGDGRGWEDVRLPGEAN